VFADYSNLFKSCLLENIVLGTLLYVTEECDISSIDIDQFIHYLYKEADIKKNITQIYFISGELKNIFIDKEIYIHANDMIKKRFYN